MPKLRAIFSRVSRPFWWPMATTLAPVEPGEAAHDGRIVTVEPVAVQLQEVLEEQAEEVARVRAPGMAGDLGALPGGEVAVDPLAAAGPAAPPGARSRRARGGARRARAARRGAFSSSSSGCSKSSCSGMVHDDRARAQHRLHGGTKVGAALTWKARLRSTTSCAGSSTCTNSGTGPACSAQIARSAASTASVGGGGNPEATRARLPCPRAARGSRRTLVEGADLLGEDHAALVAVVEAAADQHRLARAERGAPRP